jgi:sarcosine oxidase subunit gamma
MAERHGALDELDLPAGLIPFVAQLDVRAGEAAATRIGLPLEPDTTASAVGGVALWLGPDEWLVVGDDGTEQAMRADLLQAAPDATVVDLSADRTVIELSGPKTRDVLAQDCALDLHPRAFGPGQCAQTGLTRAQVVHAIEPDVFWIFVRRSFALYLVGWLTDALSSAEDDRAVAVEGDAVLHVPLHGA